MHLTTLNMTKLKVTNRVWLLFKPFKPLGVIKVKFSFTVLAVIRKVVTNRESVTKDNALNFVKKFP